MTRVLIQLYDFKLYDFMWVQINRSHSSPKTNFQISFVEKNIYKMNYNVHW